MADEQGQEPQEPQEPTPEVINQLERAGFFRQMGGLEEHLRTLAENLKSLGDVTIQRVQETESLIAHVLAIEAVLAVIVRTHPIDPAAVRALVKQRTGDVSADGQGSPAVLSVIEEILRKPGGQ